MKSIVNQWDLMPGEHEKKFKSFAPYNTNSKPITPISPFINDRASKMHGEEEKLLLKTLVRNMSSKLVS